MALLTSLFLFIVLFFFTATAGFSFFIGHLGAALLSLFSIRFLAKYYLFWVLLFIVLLFSEEPRFSLEYFLLCSSFLAFGTYIARSLKKELLERVLLYLFVFLIVFNQLKLGFYEKGSLLLWLPLALSLYLCSINKRNYMLYLLSGLALSFSNKKSSLLAFFASLKTGLSKRIFFFLLAHKFLAQ